MKDCDAARESETRFAGVARVEEPSVADALVERFVRMAENDDVRLMLYEFALENGRGCVRVDDMMNEKLQLRQFDQGGLLIAKPGVGVADDGCDRSDVF